MGTIEILLSITFLRRGGGSFTLYFGCYCLSPKSISLTCKDSRFALIASPTAGNLNPNASELSNNRMHRFFITSALATEDISSTGTHLVLRPGQLAEANAEAESGVQDAGLYTMACYRGKSR